MASSGLSWPHIGPIWTSLIAGDLKSARFDTTPPPPRRNRGKLPLKGAGGSLLQYFLSIFNIYTPLVLSGDSAAAEVV